MHQPLEGRITRFYEERRFGYIRDSEGRDHFFHADDLSDGTTPAPGVRVHFRVGLYKGRQKAIDVRRALSPAEIRLTNNNTKETDNEPVPQPK